MPLLNVPATSSRRSHSEKSRRWRSIRVGARRRVEAVQPAEELEVGRRRQLVVQARRLGQDPDPGPDRLGLVDDIEPVDGCVSLARRDERGQHPDRRRLARAVRAEEPQDLAPEHVEVHPADRPEVPESPAETGRVEHDGIGRRHRTQSDRACHNRLVTGPWNLPEVTGIGRLPMHSVAHRDSLPLDGRWRFQLLRSPDADVGEDWGEAQVPSVWTMSGTWDRPHYTNVQMPFDDRPPTVPELNPTGIYEREFEVPADWASRRVVLNVGAAESVLIVELNGEEVGVGKDAHLASEFDLTGRLRPGPNTLRLRVVKWSDATFVEDQDEWWHGGITRSVFLYATEAVHLADIRVTAGLADDLTTGTFDLAVTVGFPGDELPPGWTLEATLGRLDRTLRAKVEGIDRTTLRGWTLEDQRVMFSHAAGLLPADGRAALGGRPPQDGTAARWPRDLARRPARDRPLVRRAAEPLPADGGPARPGRCGRRGDDRPGRVPPGRDPRARPARQRAARLHPRRQSPRLRPAHRPGRSRPSRCARTSCS